MPAPESVFINCPFDSDYQPLLRALVFTIYDCGLVARSALERDDGSEVRIDKIRRIIGESNFGVHDISRTETDALTGLPRFNMPLELGIFLGAKYFGAANHARKSCVILDRDRYRYQAFCSDLAGHDIHAHGGSEREMVRAVRDAARTWVPERRLPGARDVRALLAVRGRAASPRRQDRSGRGRADVQRPGFPDNSLVTQKRAVPGELSPAAG
jgi:hypothetical protein